MGQSDIIEFLKKYPNRWFRLKEIMPQMGLSDAACNNSLRRLRHNQLVKTKLKKQHPSSRRKVWHYKYKKVR